MILFFRLVRSTLAWLHPQQGEDWAHRLAWGVTTIVTFPMIMAVCAIMLLGTWAFPGFNPELYGVKRLIGVLWLAIWVMAFFPADRITVRHLSGVEPPESRWLIVKFTAGAIALLVLAALVAVFAGDS